MLNSSLSPEERLLYSQFSGGKAAIQQRDLILVYTVPFHPTQQLTLVEFDLRYFFLFQSYYFFNIHVSLINLISTTRVCLFNQMDQNKSKMDIFLRLIFHY